MIAIFVAISWWQQKDLLATDGSVTIDPLQLPLIRGTYEQLAWSEAKPTLLYFFAPWCGVCHLSIDNLHDLKEQYKDDDLRIAIVALSYSHIDEVEAFLARHEMEIPVLLGSEQTAQDFKINGFPTYYILNKDGQIVSRDMGYSSELGLRARLLKI